MSELNNKIKDLNVDELEQVAGGAKRPPEKKGFIIYQIQRGDTLIGIAKAHGIASYKEILKWNPQIKNPSLIITGDYLYLKA